MNDALPYDWASKLRTTDTPFLSTMLRMGYEGEGSPPIIGYTKVPWTNWLWSRVARITAIPMRWMSCSSYDECDVEFQPHAWAVRHLVAPEPIYDPNWKRLPVLRGENDIYRQVGYRWVLLEADDDNVIGIERSGKFVYGPVEIKPMTMEWGYAFPPSVTIGDYGEEGGDA